MVKSSDLQFCCPCLLATAFKVACQWWREVEVETAQQGMLHCFTVATAGKRWWNPTRTIRHHQHQFVCRPNATIYSTINHAKLSENMLIKLAADSQLQ